MTFCDAKGLPLFLAITVGQKKQQARWTWEKA